MRTVKKWTNLSYTYFLRIKDGGRKSRAQIHLEGGHGRTITHSLGHGEKHTKDNSHIELLFESFLTVNKHTAYSFHKLCFWVPHSTHCDKRKKVELNIKYQRQETIKIKQKNNRRNIRALPSPNKTENSLGIDPAKGQDREGEAV